jgi:hypothetical protein
MRGLRKFVDESGQTLVLAALCIVILVAFLGLAIDVGHLRYAKRQLQSAADAAAIAAGREIRVCAVNGQILQACPYMTAAAQSALVENEPGFTGSTLISNCLSAPGAGLTIQVNSPSCYLASDPNKGKAGYVEVVVSKQEQTYFAKILGFNNISLSARAEASRDPSPPCIYALDNDKTNIAISLGIGALMQFNCTIVDESPSPQALSSPICLLVGSTGKILVHGGVSTLLALGCPQPQLKAPIPTPADPLAYLPPPPQANDACGTSATSPYFGSPNQVNVPLLSGLLSLGKPIVFNPGVYCGGIAIPVALVNNIVFNPGIYVLRQGKGMALGLLGIPIFSGVTTGGIQMTIAALSNITGNGVMFYNEGPSGDGPAGSINITEPLSGPTSIISINNFSLSAPASGEYAGVLFFQAHNVTTPGGLLLNLLGSSNLKGGIYMPDAAITYGVSALSANTNFIVAKDINFGLVGAATVIGGTDATSSLGSPLVGDDAVLVQ